jgi:dinuclear metal center YbgI/SA1388 family protein
MKLRDIFEILNQISPLELQESWDNSGLQIGSFSDEVEQIVLSIDIDLEMIDKFPEKTLFILHHPPIFGKLKSLNFDTFPANLIKKLILKKDSLIAMHTNFDKTHLNRYVFEKILGFKATCDGFICKSEVDLSLKDLKKVLNKAFGDNLRVINPKEYINSISLTTRAGASFIDEVESDCFLTGDIKYHDAMKAKSLNLMMVDIGHFQSERYFAEALKDELKNLPISVIISESENPFSIL